MGMESPRDSRSRALSHVVGSGQSKRRMNNMSRGENGVLCVQNIIGCDILN